MKMIKYYYVSRIAHKNFLFVLFACIYLGKKANVLYHNRNNIPNDKITSRNIPDKWWLRLGVTDEILFKSSSWIADISFCRIQIRR